jgi:hypothetical protein
VRRQEVVTGKWLSEVLTRWGGFGTSLELCAGGDRFGAIFQITRENQHYLAVASSIDHSVGIGFCTRGIKYGAGRELRQTIMIYLPDYDGKPDS